MRELALIGLIALGFGLGSYQATGELTGFAVLNLVVGTLGLAAAAGLALRRLRFAAGSHSRRVLLRGALGVAGALALAVALERAAAGPVCAGSHLRAELRAGARDAQGAGRAAGGADGDALPRPLRPARTRHAAPAREPGAGGPGEGARAAPLGLARGGGSVRRRGLEHGGARARLALRDRRAAAGRASLRGPLTGCARAATA
jgi:hypothetical protein